MRILLTGAAGFIGSHVARKLLSRGDEVIGVDNFNDYYDPAQKFTNVAELALFPGFRKVNSDIRDLPVMESLFEDSHVDALIHLAGYAGVRNSILNPRLYFDVNFGGTIGLLELARRYQTGNFVFASTSSVYGQAEKVPFVESAPCIEPPQPYAASKRAVEQTGFTYNQNYGLNFTSVRFFTVYGPAGRPDMMPAKLAESIVSGAQIPCYGRELMRDWTYVADIANGVVAAADHPLGFEVVNLGRGQPQSLRRFIEVMESVFGVSANLVDMETPSTEMRITFSDISKAARLIGYKPSIDIEEGIVAYCEWYKRYHRGIIPFVHEQVPCSARPDVAA